MPCLKIVNDRSTACSTWLTLHMVIVEDFDCVQVPVLSRSKIWKFKDKTDNVRINVTLRSVRETSVAMESNMYYIF
jgi:Tfp pilus assembly protein PilW